jgi:hypothetical protein
MVNNVVFCKTGFRCVRRFGITVLGVLLLVAASASPAGAAIISISGDVALVPAPASVALDVFESNDDLFVFAEQQNVLLASDLRVNFTAPGFYDDRNDLPDPVPTIAAGTAVDSYFVHADPEGRGISYVGSITFDTNVLGVILGGVLLDESDGVVGAVGTTYEADFFGAGRGLALSGEDTIELSLDRKTVSFSFTTRFLMDEVRIITAPQAVPEPATLMLMGSGLAVFAARRRRSRFHRS